MNTNKLYERFWGRQESGDLVDEVMKLLTEQAPRGTEKRQRLKTPAKAEEACGESLNWRLPNMLPTEIRLHHPMYYYVTMVILGFQFHGFH